MTMQASEMAEVAERYTECLYRMCFMMLGQHADAEDAVADTLVRCMTKAPLFQDEAHRKAWLFRVAANICRDMLRFRFRRPVLQLEELADCGIPPEDVPILEAVFRLPEKYRIVLHLFYIEGYRTEEIAGMLSISPAAVRKRLQYAREKLKVEYERNDE